MAPHGTGLLRLGAGRSQVQILSPRPRKWPQNAKYRKTTWRTGHSSGINANSRAAPEWARLTLRSRSSHGGMGRNLRPPGPNRRVDPPADVASLSCVRRSLKAVTASKWRRPRSSRSVSGARRWPQRRACGSTLRPPANDWRVNLSCARSAGNPTMVHQPGTCRTPDQAGPDRIGQTS